MAKLLSIVWYKVLPAKYGGQKGIALFNKYLSKHHPLVCLCSRNNQVPDDVFYLVIPTLPTSQFQFILPWVWYKIYKTAKQEKVTHIILEHPYHGMAGWLCKKLLDIKLIAHSHNIEFERFREQGEWWWRLLKYYERWTHRQADLNLFKTTHDKQTAISTFHLQPGKCMLVPYGVETNTTKHNKPDAKAEVCKKHFIPPANKLLLFAGTLDYAPNAKAVKDIYQHIAPSLPPGYTVIICGRHSEEQFRHPQHAHLVYAGEVEDIDPYYSAADVFINPLPSSSGIQTKTIDALAHDRNVVVFENNTEGLPLQLLKEKLFMPDNNDWEGFVKQCVQAASNSTPTPASFFEVFGWDNIIEKLAMEIAMV